MSWWEMCWLTLWTLKRNGSAQLHFQLWPFVGRDVRCSHRNILLQWLGSYVDRIVCNGGMAPGGTGDGRMRYKWTGWRAWVIRICVGIDLQRNRVLPFKQPGAIMLVSCPIGKILWCKHSTRRRMAIVLISISIVLTHGMHCTCRQNCGPACVGMLEMSQIFFTFYCTYSGIYGLRMI